MICEFFESNPYQSCRAVAGFHIPTLFERERYCVAGDQTLCPTFQLYSIRKRPLTDQEYLSLWAPEPQRRSA